MALLDGKEVAKAVRARVAVRASDFASKMGRQPSLHVVLVGDDPASQVYVRNKEKAAVEAGFSSHVHRMTSATTQDELERVIDGLGKDVSVDGILVQLPLPKGLDATRMLHKLPPEKDVDGLTRANAGALVLGETGHRPCTPSGCMELLRHIGMSDLSGKRALVIGRSILVGKPIALLLLEANATVVMAHSRTANLADECRAADIVVAAVGRPELVQGGWLKPGAVVLDVGINRLENGKLVGDVHAASALPVAGHLTPVPGGVGPMTIAMLLSNTMDAAEQGAQR